MEIGGNDFGYWLFVIFVNHACIAHVICICIRVAAEAEEVVYKVVAEPQEPQGQAPQQEERHENQAKAQLTPVLSSRLKASPVHILLFQLITPIYVSITCALGLGIDWNPSCMIPRFP